LRTKRTVWLSALLLVGLLLPQEVSGRTRTILGSLTKTAIGGTSPTMELAGVAVAHNPGFEKTVTQQLPPITIPVFVDDGKDDMTGQ
jgi:hypothetical protein